MEGIEVAGLAKRFAERTAVEGLTFDVRPGEVFGLLGPNGAGKTTTVDILSTLLPWDGGGARVAGHDVAREPDAVRAASAVLAVAWCAALALAGNLWARSRYDRRPAR